MLELVLLILGLGGLVLGTKYIIKGSLSIAEHFKISYLFIGLTILAVGTDLPELFVTITGAVHRLGGVETSGLIVGEAIGSCLGQIVLSLGIIGIFGALTLKKRELFRDGFMLLGSIVLFFVVSLDGIITRVDGFILLLIYGFYFFTLFREEKIHEKVKRAPHINLWKNILYIVLGFVVLITSSNFVITNSVSLAETWGVSQSLIGIFLLGLGTSLPELSLAIGALRKNALRLSVGNLIGSNIFDILVPLGIGSMISEFLVSKELLHFDIPFLFIATVLVIIFFRSKMKLGKKEAIALIVIYGIYAALKIFGGAIF